MEKTKYDWEHLVKTKPCDKFDPELMETALVQMNLQTEAEKLAYRCGWGHCISHFIDNTSNPYVNTSR